MDSFVSVAPAIKKRYRESTDGTYSDVQSLASQNVWTATFTQTGSDLDPFFAAPKITGSQSFSQAGSDLIISTGVTPNSEFLARSFEPYTGSMRLRAGVVSSQRIANANLTLLLADLIGENLSYSATSATSVTVTFSRPHEFNAGNVGQFMFLGGVTGPLGVPGRYAISAVPDSSTLVFSVSGWAVETGNLTLFGWNHVKSVFSGTTATSFFVDAQQNGFASGDVTATCNTTQTPGTVVHMETAGREVFWLDSLRASSASFSAVSRASRIEKLPNSEVSLYVFVWASIGPTAPASSTSWNLSFVSVESFSNVPVYLQGIRPTGQVNPLQVIATLSASSNLVGDTGLQYRATATGAASVHAVMSPATPAVTTVKGSAGKLIGAVLQNSAAALRSMKIFGVAAPNLGTTAALFEIDIPAGQTVEFTYDGGIGFATAITYAVTGAKGLTDNTGGLGVNDVSGFIAFA